MNDDERFVRVFISSTFLDMERERDVLVRHTFPALRSQFRARGVELLEVDLRWGITQEQAENGQLLPICLAEIDRCRPFFIGLLGERYGWIPPEPALTDQLQSEFPAIANAHGCSITEIEILHGVLAKPNIGPYVLFFERDPSWMEALSAEERITFAPESPGVRAKQIHLKARVRASGARVISYRSPAEIGSAVESALRGAIEARFPDADTSDVFTQSIRLHTAYARERIGLHVGAALYLAELNKWIAQSGAPPILITGAPGAGKSTLVANWLTAHRSANSRDLVFEHYIGASPDSADPILLMRRLLEYLNRATGETTELPRGNATLMDIAGGLQQRIEQASAFAKRQDLHIVIALDGIDKLASERSLRWLPEFFPSRVKLVASSLDGEASGVAASRGWTILDIKKLTATEQREFVAQTLRRWGKGLSKARQDRVLAHPLSSTPLFLKVILDELRYSATEQRLDERLQFYLQSRDMPDLYGRMLERLEIDCGREVTAQALSLVWASRAGLEEAEILSLVGGMQLPWVLLRNGLGDALRDMRGRVAFSHDFLREAVAKRYLQAREAQLAIHQVLAGHFEKRSPDGRQAEELPYQMRLAEAWDRLANLLTDLSRFNALRERGDAELLGNWMPLIERGHQPDVLLTSAVTKELPAPENWTVRDFALVRNILSFLHFCRASNAPVVWLHKKLVAAVAQLKGDDDIEMIGATSNLAGVLFDSGQLSEALPLQERILDCCLRVHGTSAPITVTSMLHLATTKNKLGDRGGALTLLERAVQASRAWNHQIRFTCLANLGTMLGSSDPVRSKALLEESVHACEKAFGPDDPQTISALTNLAAILTELKDFNSALMTAEKAADRAKRILGETHPITLSATGNLAFVLLNRGDTIGRQSALSILTNMIDSGTRRSGEYPAQTKDNLAVALQLVTRDFVHNVRKTGDSASLVQLQEHVTAAKKYLHLFDSKDFEKVSRELAVALGICGTTLRSRKYFEDAAVVFGEAANLVRPLCALNPRSYEDLWRQLLRDMFLSYQAAGRGEAFIVDALEKITGSVNDALLLEGTALVNAWTRACDFASQANAREHSAAKAKTLDRIAAFLSLHKNDQLGVIGLIMERILREQDCKPG